MRMIRLRTLGVAAAMVVGAPAFAANPAYQSFFFSTCGTATGQLALLCGVSSGGDLSGDSESSLNPNQAVSNLSGALNSVRQRLDEVRQSTGGVRSGAQSSMPAAAADAQIGAFNLFLQARGAWEEVSKRQDAQERGYDADIWSVDFGFDHSVSDTLVWGAVVNVGSFDSDFDREALGVNFTPASVAGSVESDSLGLTLFGLWRLTDALFLEGTLGYVSYEYDLARNAVFQESTRALPQVAVSTRGDPDGALTTASVLAGYDWASGAWGFGVSTGLAYAKSEIDSYTESDIFGVGLGMRFSDADRDSTLGSFTFEVSRAVSIGSGVLLPQLRVQYLHEFARDPETVSSSFILDPAATRFDVESDEPDQDYFSVGAGIVWVLQNGWIPYLDVESIVGYEDLDRYTITAGVRREL